MPLSSPKRFGVLILTVVALLLATVAVFKIATTVDAGDIVVKQNVLDGELQVWTDPGLQWQNFGSIETYTKSDQFWFQPEDDPNRYSDDADEDDKPGEEQCKTGFHIRFNDQGTAKLCGSVSWEMPTDPGTVARLHEKFRSHAAIENRLIKPALEKAIYNTGPLMSSRESSGDRRSELIAAIRDQTIIGVYRVEAEDVEVEDFFADPVESVDMVSVPVLCPDPAPTGCTTGDPMVGDDGVPIMELKPRKVMKQPMKRVKIVKPKIGADGKIVIAEKSTVTEYGVRLFNFTINRIKYDERVMTQIKAQQTATMAIQTARAEAQRAEQDALTAKAKGDAKIAQTKAAEEVKKQAETTQAETRLAVATSDLLTAEQKAKATRVTAEAEAYKKQKLITADGALDKKLNAWVKAQEAWALAASKQRLVPEVQMGTSGSGAGGGIRDLMTIMAAASAKDLALDMKIQKK